MKEQWRPRSYREALKYLYLEKGKNLSEEGGKELIRKVYEKKSIVAKGKENYAAAQRGGKF